MTGKDPQQDHVKPNDSEKVSISTTGGQLDRDGFSIPDLPSFRKRPAEELPEPNRKSQKVHNQSAPGGPDSRAKSVHLTNHEASETYHQKKAYLQVGRYLLEQFSVPAFRSHATVGLVDRHRIQFYHANHSVILVSSAIPFSSGDDLDTFIAIVIAFSRLSLQDSGILHSPRKGELFSDNGKIPTSNLSNKVSQIQKGNKLFLENGKERFELTYGEVISHEPSLTGRATAVLHAGSHKGTDLVVKISWPGSKRVAEDVFLTEATKVANSSPTHQWALNHLPRVFFVQTVAFGLDSTHEKVASLFENAEFVNGDKYEYERRALRIIVQERLYPLNTLSDVKEIAQVLLDVACGTYLLFCS